MPIFSLKCFRTDTQVARNRVRGFGLLKPHTVPARIVSPPSVAFSTLSAFQVESVEQPWFVLQPPIATLLINFPSEIRSFADASDLRGRPPHLTLASAISM